MRCPPPTRNLATKLFRSRSLWTPVRNRSKRHNDQEAENCTFHGFRLLSKSSTCNRPPSEVTRNPWKSPCNEGLKESRKRRFCFSLIGSMPSQFVLIWKTHAFDPIIRSLTKAEESRSGLGGLGCLVDAEIKWNRPECPRGLLWKVWDSRVPEW